MGLFSKKTTRRYNLETMTDEELDVLYEKCRIEWINNGFNDTGDITPEMKRIYQEMNKREGEKVKNDPMRNKNPNYHWKDENRWEKD